MHYASAQCKITEAQKLIFAFSSDKNPEANLFAAIRTHNHESTCFIFTCYGQWLLGIEIEMTIFSTSQNKTPKPITAKICRTD
jgi:hypothetical protein